MTETTTGSDLEVAAPPAPAHHHPQPATPSIFDDPDPAGRVQRATEVATVLTGVIEDRSLFKEISGRRHVLVDGWTLLGVMVGVAPVTVWTRKIEDETAGTFRPPTTEIRPATLHSKYCSNGRSGHQQTDGCDTYTKEKPVVVDAGLGGWEARVEVKNAAGMTIGAAESECRWSEPTWADRDSYALRSMAQTRATSKALRQPLGFIVQLAGFEATPAEEMPAHLEGAAGGEDTYTGPRCPACNSPVFDNRAENDEREQRGQNRRPEFKCRNRTCTGDDGQPWISWDPNTFADYRGTAKVRCLDAVLADPEGWADRYRDDLAHPRREVITTSLTMTDDDDRTRAQAGIVWLDIVDHLNIGDDQPIDRDYAYRIGVIAEMMLRNPGDSVAAAEAEADRQIEAADSPFGSYT